MRSNISDIVDQLCIPFTVCTILKVTRAGHLGDTVRTGSGPFEGVNLKTPSRPHPSFQFHCLWTNSFTVYERSFTVKETTLCLAQIDFARQAGGVTVTPP